MHVIIPVVLIFLLLPAWPLLPGLPIFPENFSVAQDRELNAVGTVLLRQLLSDRAVVAKLAGLFGINETCQLGVCSFFAFVKP